MASPLQLFHTKKQKNRGFTLMELLVVASIIVILSVVVIARYRDYDSTVLLRNVAYETALTIRDSQLRSISVGAQGSNFNLPYGVHFDSTSAGNTTYTLFYDSDNSGELNGNESVATYTLGRKITVDRICVEQSGSSGCTPVSQIDMTFKRPHLEGVFRSNPHYGQIDQVRVTLSSPSGNTHQIQINKLGKISVI